MRIWIDLANSPHPLLFAPIARELERLGHEVLLTARAHAQTAELARQQWNSVSVIGGASPPGRRRKALSVAQRVRTLRDFAASVRPDVALSHNSYAQIVAARSLGVRIVTAMDFEHQPANHVAFRLASTILLPEALPEESVRRQGAKSRKIRRYPGLKESLYLGDFEPDPGVLPSLGVEPAPDSVIVLARTAPSRALYHRFENRLFLDCLRTICRQSQVTCIVLPRHPEHGTALRGERLEGCIVPDTAVDARSILHQADLFLGAGGTMTREAALMGIPTCSVFGGDRPSVDRWLERRGLLRQVMDPSSLEGLGPRPAPPRALEDLRKDAEGVLDAFLRAITHDDAAGSAATSAVSSRRAR